MNPGGVDLNGSVTQYTVNAGDVIPGAILMPLIGLTAIVGNALVIAVYVKHPEPRDSTMKFILNLAITDCTTGVVSIPHTILFLTGSNGGSFIECILSTLVLNYLTMVSQSLVLVTTFERYTAICNRERYTKIMTKASTNGLIAAAWLVPIPLTFISLFLRNNWDSLKWCYYPKLLPLWKYHLDAVATYIVMTLACFMYGKILLKARSFYRRLNPVSLHGINTCSVNYRSIQKSIRNGKVIGFVTFLFITCWLPYNIFLTLYGLGYTVFNIALLTFAYVLGITNSIMNPFIYAWQKERFRQHLKKLLCSRKVDHSTTTITTNSKTASGSHMGRRTGKRTMKVHPISEQLPLPELIESPAGTAAPYDTMMSEEKL